MSQSTRAIAKFVRRIRAAIACSRLSPNEPKGRSVSSIRAVPLERRPTKEKAGSGIPAFSGIANKVLLSVGGNQTGKKLFANSSRKEYTRLDPACASGQPHFFECGLTSTNSERSRGIGSPRKRITRQVSIWHWSPRTSLAGSAILPSMFRQ